MSKDDWPYAHPYQFTPNDGPSKGVLQFLPRRYQAYGPDDGSGIYVWHPELEGYKWHQGLTLAQWMKDNGWPKQDKDGHGSSDDGTEETRAT